MRTIAGSRRMEVARVKITDAGREDAGKGAAMIAEAHGHGYEPTREAAMAAFAKSWRREEF